MLRDHILSSLPQHSYSSGQPFFLLGEESVRRSWQSNTAWASCCALGWSTSPGLEVVFGLLRTGEQFSNKEHYFTSWGEPKSRGVYSELYPVSPESCCPSANLCLLPQLGIFPLPSITKVSNLQKVPILNSGSFLFPRPYQASYTSVWQPAPAVDRPWQPLAVSSLVPHLLSLLQMLCSRP